MKKLGIIVVALLGLGFLADAGFSLYTGKVTAPGGREEKKISKEEDPIRYRNNVATYAFIGAGLLWLAYKMNKE